MKYQDVFRCLKGVGSIDLSGLVIPIPQTSYALHPINCRLDFVNGDIVTMLTNARNAQTKSFLTYFTSTPERTTRWLSTNVACDDTRILFALKKINSNQLYGYMGLAYADSEGKRIEGDAIVRYATEVEPGLMRTAFLHLVNWVITALNFEQVCIRVLSDNPAVGFYERCDFEVLSVVPLYEVWRGDEIIELTESVHGHNNRLSSRTLTHMRYKPSAKSDQIDNPPNFNISNEG